MRRIITLAAISAAALFALPTMSAHAQTTPVSVADAADFAQQFTADNPGDLIRNTVVRRSRSLGCLADNANSSADCALLVTLERRRSLANSNDCNTCANTAKAKARARALTLRRWQCLVVVRVTAIDDSTIDESDVSDEFTGEFVFDNCVRVRTRPVVNPL